MVLALEFKGVCLGHHHGILVPFKDLDLVNFLNPTSCELSFLDHCDLCYPFPISIFTQPRAVLYITFCQLLSDLIIICLIILMKSRADILFSKSDADVLTEFFSLVVALSLQISS